MRDVESFGTLFKNKHGDLDKEFKMLYLFLLFMSFNLDFTKKCYEPL